MLHIYSHGFATLRDSLGRFEYKMLQVVVFNSESDTQFFDTQDGGEKKRKKALEMVKLSH